MASLQCPECKSAFPKKIWRSHKGRYGFYYCPDCRTKLHWDDLEKAEKNIK
ncbi:MAG: hypothetical protein ACOC1K_05060 [Nanoarchaeota archaeon]